MTATVIKHRIKKYWDWRSASFGRDSNKGKNTTEEWKRFLGSRFQDARGRSVLDLGTGTGDIALYFAEAGFLVTGIDISSEMISCAKENARQTGLSVSFERGDAENLRFEDNSFDILTLRNILWTLPSPQKALSECKRVLRPGGKILLSDGFWDNTTLKSFPNLVWKTLRIFLNRSSFISFRFFFEYLWFYDLLPFYRGVTASQAKKLIEETGFRNIEIFENCFSHCHYGKNSKDKPNYFILIAKS